jgi:hypothetical protein
MRITGSTGRTLVTEFRRRQHEDMFPSYENSLIKILRTLHEAKRR